MSGVEPLSPDEVANTIGISTTVPVEVVYAAGLKPVDLNNLFINSGAAEELVIEAEKRGFPRNSCAWAKGVYATARALGLERVVAVVQGDCANSHAVAERLRDDGVEVVPFSFPYSPEDAKSLDMALERFARDLGTCLDEAHEWKARLDRARAPAHRIDALAWKENRVTGIEQHVWTISCSDFFSDPQGYAADAQRFIAEAERRAPFVDEVRLGLLGVPPICDNFFSFIEERGARVVFNEVPRQFAMPYQTASLREQYARYTYPYDIFRRIDDMREEVSRRNVHGVVHYVQSFCHRQIQDAVIRRRLDVPLLTLECDRPGRMGMQAETRIEAFLEMLRGVE